MNDAGGMVTQIIELIRKVPFDIRCKLITKHKNTEQEYNSNPFRHLMNSCDDEESRLLKKIKTDLKKAAWSNLGNSLLWSMIE